MSYSKTHDLAVKVGEYEKNGETKGRYENVGLILSDGQKDLYMVKRTFNPAGVPNPDNKDSVLLSAFPVNNERRESKPRADEPPPPPAFDDDIPF